LEKAGLAMSWFSTETHKKFGVDTLGVDKAFGVVLVTGWNTHPNFMSEDEVYKLLKEMIARKDELAKMNAYYEVFAKDPIELQVTAISLAPVVPVHPGLAKLLKEHGAWRGEWKIAS